MKVGVFISAHWHDAKFGDYRCIPNFGEIRIERFKYIIESYKYYNSGADQTIFVLDAESNLKEFTDWIPTVEHVEHVPIKNVGGSYSGIKYCMHLNPDIMDDFDYFFFHTDDSVQVVDHNWASDMIEEYESDPDLVNGGSLGWAIHALKFSKDGLFEKDGCGKHFAKMWNIIEPVWIPVLQSDWMFMDRKTLKTLSKVWYDPIASKESMDLQIELENINFLELLKYPEDLRMRDSHVGREIEFVTRLRYFGMDGAITRLNKIERGAHMAERK